MGYVTMTIGNPYLKRGFCFFVFRHGSYKSDFKRLRVNIELCADYVA